MYDTGGEVALAEISRRKPVLKNRVAPEVEAAVIALAIAEPAWGQVRAANELTQGGVRISPGACGACGCGTISAPCAAPGAFEAKVAQDGEVLTEAQIIALEKPKPRKKRTVNLRANAQGIAGRRIRFTSAR